MTGHRSKKEIKKKGDDGENARKFRFLIIAINGSSIKIKKVFDLAKRLLDYKLKPKRIIYQKGSSQLVYLKKVIKEMNTKRERRLHSSKVVLKSDLNKDKTN